MGYELQAIAAVVIGGTSLPAARAPSSARHRRADHLRPQQRAQSCLIPQEWQNVILGIVILVAVYADMARTNRAA